MTTESTIQEINKLPLTDKLLIIERTVKDIRQDSKSDLDQAVDILYNDYRTGKELTIFTELDSESLYEAR